MLNRIASVIFVLFATVPLNAQPAYYDSVAPTLQEIAEKELETGDFVAPIQEILYYADQAALNLYLVCYENGDRVLSETMRLHTAVHRHAKDRPRLQVILSVAEHLTTPNKAGQPPNTPYFFRDRDNLMALQERAQEVRELHRQVLVYVKAFRHREFNSPNDTLRVDVESLDEVGHPASFLSVEMRHHLHSIGMPIGHAEFTNHRHLERPSHLELGIDRWDKDFAKAIRLVKQIRPIEISTSHKGNVHLQKSEQALKRVRDRLEESKESGE